MGIFARTGIAIFALAVAVGGFSTGGLLMAPTAEAYTYELVIKKSVLITKGRALLYKGEPDQAVSLYERALESNLSVADQHNVNNDLCVAYFFKREFEKALERCDAAIASGPNRWKPYNNRGNVYLEKGDLDRAVADYDKGLKLLPSSEVLAANRTLALFLAGESQLPSGAPVDGEGWADEDAAGELHKLVSFAGP